MINSQSWSHQDAQVHVCQLSACSVQINIQISWSCTICKNSRLGMRQHHQEAVNSSRKSWPCLATKTQKVWKLSVFCALCSFQTMQSMNSSVKTRQMKTDQKKMLMFVKDLKTGHMRNKPLLLSAKLYCAFQCNSFRGTKCVNCCSYNSDHIMTDVTSCRSLADTNPIQTKLLCQVTFMQSCIMG